MDTSLTGFYSDPATKAMREPAPKLTTDDQLQSARQQLTEAGKSKGMLKQAQAGEKAEQTKMLAEADVQGRETFQKALETDPFRAEYREKVKEQADTKFVPTQETAGDLGLLFTLTNILGFAIGGKSKGNAQAAMSAMNGMLEGHQKGRQDIYKQEKDKFDENFKALDKTIQSLKTQYEDAMKTYANDREEGMAKARMAIAEHNARFIQDSLEKFGPAYAYDQIRDTVSMLEKAKVAEQKLQDAEERRAETARRDAETARFHRETEALRREQMGLTKTLAQDRQGKGEIFQGKDGAMYRVTPDNKVVKIEGSEGFSKLPSASKPTPSLGSTAFLNSVIGASSGNKKTDKSIVDAAQGVNQLGQVINLFKDPDVKTGVIAKLAPIREKMASIGDNNHEITDDEMRRIIDGEISPTAKNAVAQKEALFAAYTAEREIAGGRLLVSVVKQAGGALDPTNYEKQGYLNLLNSRQEELRSRLRGARLDDDQIDDVVHALKTQKRKSVSEPQQTSPGFNVPSVSDIDAELARRGIK